jgi:hypothetical protein
VGEDEEKGRHQMSFLGRAWFRIRSVFSPYASSRIESGTAIFPDATDVIRQFVIHIADGSHEGWADFKVDRCNGWVQVAHEDSDTFVVNFEYGFDDPPDERLRKCGVELPKSWTQTFFKGQLAATFAVPVDEVERAVHFVDSLFRTFYGCGPSYTVIGNLDG